MSNLLHSTHRLVLPWHSVLYYTETVEELKSASIACERSHLFQLAKFWPLSSGPYVVQTCHWVFDASKITPTVYSAAFYVTTGVKVSRADKSGCQTEIRMFDASGRRALAMSYVVYFGSTEIVLFRSSFLLYTHYKVNQENLVGTYRNQSLGTDHSDRKRPLFA
jgi:hypothetical protein